MRPLRLSLAVLLLLASPLLADDQKTQIGSLPAATSLDADDLMVVSQNGTTKKADVSVVRRLDNSATLPATCTEGDLYQDTDSTAPEVYSCTATDTWTKLGGEVATGDFAPFGQYDPNNEAASLGTGGVRYEFDDGTFSCTWGNQDASTVAENHDSAFFNGDGAANEEHVCGVATPGSNADFTWTGRVTWEGWALAANDGCVMGLIEAGTVATPTELTTIEIVENGGTDLVQVLTMTSYAFAGFATVGSLGTVASAWTPIEDGFCFQFDYTDSTRSTAVKVSTNCIDWYTIGTTVLSADPPYAYFGVRDNGECRFKWVQFRTDANRTQAGE